MHIESRAKNLATSRDMSVSRLEKPVRISEQVWPDGMAPVVSVLCVTYNHVRFIRDAMEGFLFQETTFPVEIVVHDDASTDGTTDILREYARNHASVVRHVAQPKNLWPNVRGTELVQRYCRGEFIAMCEGDDYWLTSEKLQRQVDAILRHADVTLCYHSHQLVNKQGVQLPSPMVRDRLEIFDRGDFIRGKFGDLTTASVLFRRSMLDLLPSWYADLPFGDISLYALASLRGRIAVIPGVHSAYRRHSGGIYNVSRLADDEDFHFAKELWWRRAICDLFSSLASETDDPKLKQACLKRAFDENMEASWFARLAGKSETMIDLVLEAFRCGSGLAMRDVFWWKQLFFSLFPEADLKRWQRLEEYRQHREDLRMGCVA